MPTARNKMSRGGKKGVGVSYLSFVLSFYSLLCLMLHLLILPRAILIASRSKVKVSEGEGKGRVPRRDFSGSLS